VQVKGSLLLISKQFYKKFTSVGLKLVAVREILIIDLEGDSARVSQWV